MATITQPAAGLKAPEHGPTARVREGGQARSPGCGVAPLRGPPWRSGSTPLVSVRPPWRAAGAGRGRGGGRGGGGPVHPASLRSLPPGLRGRTRRRASSARGASLRSSPGSRRWQVPRAGTFRSTHPAARA